MARAHRRPEYVPASVREPVPVPHGPRLSGLRQPVAYTAVVKDGSGKARRWKLFDTEQEARRWGYDAVRNHSGSGRWVATVSNVVVAQRRPGVGVPRVVQSSFTRLNRVSLGDAGLRSLIAEQSVDSTPVVEFDDDDFAAILFAELSFPG